MPCRLPPTHPLSSNQWVHLNVVSHENKMQPAIHKYKIVIPNALMCSSVFIASSHAMLTIRLLIKRTTPSGNPLTGCLCPRLSVWSVDLPKTSGFCSCDRVAILASYDCSSTVGEYRDFHFTHGPPHTQQMILIARFARVIFALQNLDCPKMRYSTN